MARGFNYRRLALQDRVRQNGWEQVEPHRKKKTRSKHTKYTKKSTRGLPQVFEWDPPRP